MPKDHVIIFCWIFCWELKSILGPIPRQCGGKRSRWVSPSALIISCLSFQSWNNPWRPGLKFLRWESQATWDFSEYSLYRDVAVAPSRPPWRFVNIQGAQLIIYINTLWHRNARTHVIEDILVYRTSKTKFVDFFDQRSRANNINKSYDLWRVTLALFPFFSVSPWQADTL